MKFKQNEQMMDYLQRLYRLKVQRDHQPDEPISVSRNGVRNFSFLPHIVGVREYPLSYLAEQQTAPSIRFTEPSGEPLALWLFSRSEQALAVIFVEQPVISDVADPGLRIFEMVTGTGAVTIAGDFKPVQVVLTHAYLLPLDKLDLDETGGWRGDALRLDRVVEAVPLLFGVTAATNAPAKARLDSREALGRLFAAGPRPFHVAAWVMRWIILPLVLLWSIRLLVRLRKLRREWNDSLLLAIPHAQTPVRHGLFHFLIADLKAERERLIAQTAAQRQEEATRQQEQLRRRQFETEIRQCLNTLAQLGQEGPCQEDWLAGASTVELEEMAAHCHNLVQQHQEQIEREQQAAREQMRQIHRLESEFTVIPPEERAGVMDAWALYEQACATGDLRKRLEMLKSARKLLPKEFRIDPV